MDLHRVALAAAALSLSACEPEYIYEYVPVTYATVDDVTPREVTPKSGGDQAAADFPITKDNRRGDLRVASYGLVDIGPQTRSERTSAIHVRMTLTNDSDRPWTIDAREQRIQLESYGTSVAAFVSADPGTSPPSIIVPSKGKRTLDLFFPLPVVLQKSENLPSFDTMWRVHAGDETVDGVAPFDAIAVQPPAVAAPYDYGPDYYWGPPYWYNPYYADFGFYGAYIIPPFYFGYPLWVHHHDHYGHFHGGYHHNGGSHHGYHGGYGGYGRYGGYPHGGHPYGGRPQGAYPHAPPGGYSHGAYPHNVYPRGGGAYPHGQANPYHYQNRPSYRPPSGGWHGGYRGAPMGGGHR